MLITLIILVLSAAFFVAGKVRSDIVALCALIGLLIFQILTPEEALSGFSNSVVIMMVGLFVVGGAIFQTGLAKMISSRILKLAGLWNLCGLVLRRRACWAAGIISEFMRVSLDRRNMKSGMIALECVYEGR